MRSAASMVLNTYCNTVVIKCGTMSPSPEQETKMQVNFGIVT